ncbi:MAG: Na/Pi cotransporter family protein [Candidatus Cellulosilyticum pullistercoris]|uniref:Na/Pi cotransporter family protein n=1 Tax=Candidatus Cellulosilyticum pullistercoris TaxID=2838521 RepID=A0A9E2KDP5_9FIRM|nr:Na/Pi cotransporter family protein [Candidatus Cellulosilyticum pullistercoris]
MNIFSVFTLFGGLAFFLYGMNIMSNGLEKMTGGKLERTLKKMTKSPIRSLLLGAGITIAIQSSSAMTVMLVGFVNSGIMELGQTIGIIMGSNIGTTLTAWILSLAGIQSDNFIIQLLNPEAFSPIVALIGIILMMTAKSTKKKDIGNIMLGFSILMFGMNLMSDAVSPLADMPEFAKILVAFTNPLLGVAAGTIFTGIIQSSAASVGILQALSLTGGITYGMAMPIIMGQNIGTCVTAIISSIGVNKNAKRVAGVHIYFNLIGTIICLAVFYLVSAFIQLDFVNEAISPVGIAAVHSIFNIVTTIMLLPFSKQLEKLAKFTIRDKDTHEKYTFLDERLLATPSVAIAECKESTIKMALLTQDTLNKSINLLTNYDQKVVEEIIEQEQAIDDYEDKLGTYLVKLSSKELSDEDSQAVSRILHMLGDFERIGDHALNLSRVATELHDKEIMFSNGAKKETEVITSALKEIMELTVEVVKHNDVELAKKIEPLEEVIDYLKSEIKKSHIRRLKEGQCTIEQGFIFSDLLTNYERISDHCSNIAVCTIQVSESSFETHEYLQGIKSEAFGAFSKNYHDFMEKYTI